MTASPSSDAADHYRHATHARSESHSPMISLDRVCRVFCLPCAGGGVAHFHRWQKHAPDGLELAPLCPPGRERRHDEPLLTSFHEIVDDLLGQMRLADGEPYVMVGHSMGALVGYAIARQLSLSGHPPSLFIAAACRPPHFGAHKPPLHAMRDSELIEELGRRYGNDTSIFERPEARRLFLPIVQADLQAIETHEARDLAPLDCPLVAVGGESDRSVKSTDLEGWQDYTTADFDCVLRPGGHFFVQQDRDWLLDCITRWLAS